MNEQIQILDVTRQIVWSGLADFIVCSNSDDILGLLKATYSLVADLEDKEVTKEEIDKLNKLNFEINYNIKPYLEGLKKKQLVTADITSPKFINYRKGLAKKSLIDLDCYKTFYKLIKKTILINQTIHNDYIVEAKRKYYLFKLEDEKEKAIFMRSLEKENEEKK